MANQEPDGAGPLSRHDVAKVARLALLDLTDDELDRFTPQLGAVLDRARELLDFDVDGVAPTAHPYPLLNVFRPDESPEPEPSDGAITGAVLAVAPDVEDGCFKVPPALGEEP